MRLVKTMLVESQSSMPKERVFEVGREKLSEDEVTQVGGPVLLVGHVDRRGGGETR